MFEHGERGSRRSNLVRAGQDVPSEKVKCQKKYDRRLARRRRRWEIIARRPYPKTNPITNPIARAIVKSGITYNGTQT